MNIYYNDTLRKVFFENKNLTKRDVQGYFSALSEHEKSYLGFLDTEGTVVIIQWHSKNKWLIDNPVVPDTLHLQRYASTEESLEFIDKIYQEYTLEIFKDFYEVPVKEFTLEEMIAFKQEDDMLLREEQPLPKKEVKREARKKTSHKKKSSSNSFVLGNRIDQEKEVTPSPRKETNSDKGYFSI